MVVIILPVLPLLIASSDAHTAKQERAEIRRPIIFEGKSADEWIDLLRNGDSDGRQRAALALGGRSMATNAVVQELCRAMRDKDVFVAQNAMIALERLGPSAADALPALIKALNEGDKYTRANVSSIIGGLGPAAAKAAPTLINALKDDSEYVRSNAAVALRNIGLRTPAITEPLAEALGDKSHLVGCSAALALWKLTGSKAGLPVLQATLRNGSGLALVTAADALGEMGREAKQAAPTLRRALQAHMEDALALDLAMALWKTNQDPVAVTALGKMLDNYKLGSIAADNLAAIGPAAKATTPALRRAMNSDDEPLAANAARALWIVDKQEAALSRLYKLLQQGNSKTRADCCMYLAEAGPSPRTVSALRKALRDTYELVRGRARWGLKRLGAD